MGYQVNPAGAYWPLRLYGPLVPMGVCDGHVHAYDRGYTSP